VDQINLFGCQILKHAHVYLHNYVAEDHVWKEAHTHFGKMGVYEKMADAVEVPMLLFDSLGYHMAYASATILLAMREQHPLTHPPLSNLTYSDWNYIERIWTTHQYGVYTKWMFDLKNSRMFKFWLDKFETKIGCIKTQNDCS
jgi:hypothetical protein